MGTSIGTLVGYLTADASGLKSGMAEGERIVKTKGSTIDKELARIGRRFGRMSLSGLVGGMAMIHTAAGTAQGLLQKTYAEADLTKALAGDSAAAMVKAELAVMDANGKMIESLPLVGGAIRQITDAFGDRRGIEAMLKNMEEAEKGVVHLHETQRKLAQETALEAARLAKAPESEVARIRGAFASEELQKLLNKLKAERAVASQAADDAKKPSEDARKAYEINLAAYGPDNNLIVGLKAEYEKKKAVEDAARATAVQAESDYQKALADIQTRGVQTQAEIEQKRLNEQIENERKVYDFLADETGRLHNAVDRDASEAVMAAQNNAAMIQEIMRKSADEHTRIDAEAQAKKDELLRRSQEEELRQYREEGAAAQAMSNKMLSDLQHYQDAMEREGKSLTDSMMTPEEKRAKQLARYKELLAAGTIDQATYDRAISKMGGPSTAEVGKPAALSFGTSEAYSASLGSGNADAVKSNTAQTVTALKTVVAKLDTINRTLETQSDDDPYDVEAIPA